MITNYVLPGTVSLSFHGSIREVKLIMKLTIKKTNLLLCKHKQNVFLLNTAFVILLYNELVQPEPNLQGLTRLSECHSHHVVI